ncbi:hypothetical protein ACWCOP_06185 [Maricaulaceae bacterium MS644]
MSDAPKSPSDDERQGGLKRAGFSLGAFVITLGFIWIVFENLALALMVALVLAGGAQALQQKVKRD